jgi:hypothetical protein
MKMLIIQRKRKRKSRRRKRKLLKPSLKMQLAVRRSKVRRRTTIRCLKKDWQQTKPAPHSRNC